MKVKMIGFLLCSVLLNCSTVMAQTRYEHVLEKAEEFQFINYPEINQMIVNLKKKRSDIEKTRDSICEELLKLREESIKLCDSKDSEDLKRIAELEALSLAKSHERNNQILLARRYNEFIHLMEHRKSEIVREQNFLRRIIVRELAEGLPNALFKESPFYKQLVNEPNLELETDIVLRSEKIDSFITCCNTKLANLRAQGIREVERDPSLEPLKVQIREAAELAGARCKEVIEANPELKALKEERMAIREKIDAAGYSSDERNRQYILQVDVIKSPTVLARKLDDVYRQLFENMLRLVDQKNQKLLELWAESKSESFIEYCKWLTLKAKHRAYHQLAEQRQ